VINNEDFSNKALLEDYGIVIEDVSSESREKTSEEV